MSGKRHKKELWLDPRAKLFLILMCVLSSMFAPSLAYQFILVMLIAILGAFFGKWKYVIKAVCFYVNCSPSSRQLKKYKFFLPAEIYLLAVFMQLASKFHVFPLVLKFQDSFANVCCCSNLYNLRSFLREYFYQ